MGRTPLRAWVFDTKQANFLTSSADLEETSSFIKKVGTNSLIRDKSARFAAPVPSQFVPSRQRFLAPHISRRRRGLALCAEEVLLCDPTGNRTPICRMKTCCPNH